MLASETVAYAPRAWSETEDRVVVSMKSHGCELLVFFTDLSGEGPIQEFRLLPDSSELEPKTLRQFAPQAPLYVQHARAMIRWDRGEIAETAAALRTIGATRRGLGDDFYKLVAQNYEALVAEGERHPIKALAEMHHVVVSTTSRWVTEARNRGLIPQRGMTKKADAPLEELGLPTKALHPLKRIGLKTVGDLVKRTEADLAKIPNYRPIRIAEVESALAAHGLRLRH